MASSNRSVHSIENASTAASRWSRGGNAIPKLPVKSARSPGNFKYSRRTAGPGNGNSTSVVTAPFIQDRVGSDQTFMLFRFGQLPDQLLDLLRLAFVRQQCRIIGHHQD